MTKTESVQAISDVTGMGKTDVLKFFAVVAELAKKQVKRMDSIILPGLGKLAARKRDARVARNPATGEKVNVPAKRVVKFTVAKDLKDAVARSKQ